MGKGAKIEVKEDLRRGQRSEKEFLFIDDKREV